MSFREEFDETFPIVRALTDLMKHDKPDNHFVTITAEDQERCDLPMVAERIRLAMIANKRIKDVIIIIEQTESPRFDDLLMEWAKALPETLSGQHITSPDKNVFFQQCDPGTFEQVREKYPPLQRA